MRTRQLGRTELQLTTIGIGTWAIGGGDWKFGWGQQDEQAAVKAILSGVEQGINWIDTAAVYGDGRSEEIVARAMQHIVPADRPLIATKCGRIVQPDGNIVARITRESILQECAASARRLNTDCIDLYQLHWPDPDEEIEDAWRAMEELQQAGRVRHIGVSNHSVAQMKRLQTIHSIASLQPPYSLIARDVENEILPYCREQQIGVVCYSPMAKGLLTGAFSTKRAANLPTDDHRSRDPKFQPPLVQIHLGLADGLRLLADRLGRSVAELAIAWVLRRPEVTSAIVGARRPDQIVSLVGAADFALTSDDLRHVSDLLEQHQAQLDALGSVDTGRV